MNVTKYIEQSKEDFLNQHRGVVLSFSSYYKYKFYFKAYIENETQPIGALTLVYGGDSSDIYRFDLGATDQYKAEDLDWYSGEYVDWVNGIHYSFCE